MARRVQEITYTAPLTVPVQTDAYIAPGPEHSWRVVCFPGTPCRKAMFYRLLKAAPSDLDMVVITRPGFAKAHKRPVTDLGEQVKAALPFLGQKKTIMLGVSYGGALALKTALDYPTHVQGVVSVAALVTEAFPYARRLADLGDYAWANALVTRRARHVSAEIRARRTQVGPLFARLEDLEIPVEILHGRLDTLVPTSDAWRLKALIGDRANLELVAAGTHYLEVQTPRRILSAIKRVIARVEC